VRRRWRFIGFTPAALKLLQENIGKPLPKVTRAHLRQRADTIREILQGEQLTQQQSLVSMLFGVLFASSATEIPHGLNVFLKFVGDIAAPSALFSLGIILSQTNAFDRIVPSVSISIIKLLAHPIFAWIFLSGVFGFMLSDVKTSMMAAAAPCGKMAFVLALNYQVRTDAIAPAILFTT